MTRLARNAGRYALVGLLNSAAGFAVIAAVLHLAPDRPVLANAAGFATGFLIGFVLNKGWTFDDTRSYGATIGPYAVLVALCYAANLAVVLAAGRLPGIGIYLPQLMGMVTYTLLLFCGSHFYVFRRAGA